MGLMGANKGFRTERGFRGMGEGDCKKGAGVRKIKKISANGWKCFVF